MASNYTVRSYGEHIGDWEMVAAWWLAHGTPRALVQAALPPVGIIVSRDSDALAALWCHLSTGVGVAFLDHPVTRPGLSLIEAATAMGVALDAMEEICRTHDYGLMIANTLPAIARWLEHRRGFQRGGERVQMFKEVKRHGS